MWLEYDGVLEVVGQGCWFTESVGIIEYSKPC